MPVINFNAVAPDVQVRMPEAVQAPNIGNAFLDAYTRAEDKQYTRDRQAKADAWQAQVQQRQQTEWQRADDTRAAQMDAGRMAASGDIAGASKRLMTSGDIDGGFTITQKQHDHLSKIIEMGKAFSAAAAAATSPQEWASFKERAQRYGIDMSPYDDADWTKSQSKFALDHEYEKTRVTQELARRKVVADVEQSEASAEKSRAEAANLRATGGEKPPPGYRYSAGKGGSLEPIPGGPHDPNTPTSTIINDAAKAAQSYQTLIGALDDYEKLVSSTGFVVSPGQTKDAVLQARRNIQLHAKELFNLGVLNGPDMMLMDQMLVDPTINSPLDLTNAYDTVNRTKASVQSLKSMFKSATEAKLATTRQSLPSVPGQAPPALPGQPSAAPPPPPAAPQAPQAGAERRVLQAREAIAQGADPSAVAEQLKSLGIDPAVLGP